ncbi:MAG: DUF4199 domain-containing protein [Bacteroidales bacterium]|nr:DUF4199 domain-containing protein [Bacteroidales bacterium]
MTEEVRDKAQGSVFKFAFRWGSIIGFFTLVYYLTGFYTGWDKSLYFNDVYFFVEIAMIAWMIVTYRKENELEYVKFSRIMLIGFYASLIIAGFYTLYFFLRMERLDTMFFQTYFSQVLTMIKEQFNIDYSKAVTPQMNTLFKASFLFSLYISSIISNMIYTLLLAAFMSFNQRIYKKQ